MRPSYYHGQEAKRPLVADILNNADLIESATITLSSYVIADVNGIRYKSAIRDEVIQCAVDVRGIVIHCPHPFDQEKVEAIFEKLADKVTDQELLSDMYSVSIDARAVLIVIPPGLYSSVACLAKGYLKVAGLDHYFI